MGHVPMTYRANDNVEMGRVRDLKNDNGNGDTTEEAGTTKSTHSTSNARNGMKWTGGIGDPEKGSIEEKHARPVHQAEDGGCAHEPRKKRRVRA